MDYNVEFSEDLDGVVVNETNLLDQTNGIYVNYDNTPIILIKRDLSTVEKRCILAEEIGHYYKTSGDITDQTNMENVKQEIRARRWAYERLVPIERIMLGLHYGHETIYDLAEYLDVTDAFMLEVIEYYKLKHGLRYERGTCVLELEPLRLIKGGNCIEWLTQKTG